MTSQWACLRADLDRYMEFLPPAARSSPLWRLRIACTTEAFWAIFWYRFGRWVTLDVRVPVVRQLLLAVHAIAFRTLRLLLGVSLERQCEAGPGLYIGHFGGIWINPDARLGRNVSLSQGVTIGLGGRGAMAGVPTIGDDVFLGPHAVVIGKVTVGDGCSIGANSLVLTSMPAGASAVGVPARVVALGVSDVAARAIASAQASQR